MARCATHRIEEPCYYCEQGFGPFVNVEARIELLEHRVRGLELGPPEPREDEKPQEPVKFREAIGVIRDYALGDLVMLSASLKALKDKNPDRPLVFVTRPELMEVLDGAPYIDLQLPKSTHENIDFYKRYDLCHAVETEAGGTLSVRDFLTKPRPDIFAELLGVEKGARKFPLPVNPQALTKLRTILYGCKPPIIGLAPTCNSAVRVMPPEYVEPLTKMLLEKYGGTVVLVGKTKKWNQFLADLKLPRLVNLIDALEVRDLIAAVSLMHALVTPDTGTMHVAGALEVKTLCVMGNNNPVNFANFYPSVEVMQAKELSCVPCNDRSIPCTPLPPGQWGADCMQAMTPVRIIEKFQKVYNGHNIAYLHDTPTDFIGGAEITTKCMVEAGYRMGYNVRLFDNTTPIEKLYSIYNYDLIILSNIWRFSEEAMSIIMKAIRTVPFVKYDHDYDSLEDKAIGKWPMENYARKIFHNSVLNIFVSPDQKKDYQKLADGICIPELIDTSLFKPVPEVPRVLGSGLVGVPRKWDQEYLQKFMNDHPGIRFDVLDRVVPHQRMPELYSKYEYFAHYPQRKWPCDRVVLEAALCGCKIMANGAPVLSWGRDLTDRLGLKSWLEEVPGQFWGKIEELCTTTP